MRWSQGQAASTGRLGELSSSPPLVEDAWRERLQSVGFEEGGREEQEMNAKRTSAMVAVLGFGLFASLLPVLAAASASAPPLEAYGSLPTFDELELSPSGQRLALVKTEGSARAVAVVSLPEGKPIAGARVGDEKLRGIRWADEEHLLIYRSVTSGISANFVGRGEFMNVLSLDARTGKTTSLPVTGKGDNLMNTVLSEPTVRRIDGHTVLFFTCMTILLD